MNSKEIHIQAGSLVILSGLPGSGKSTLKETAKGFRDLSQAWVSTDEIRVKLLGTSLSLDSDGEVIEVVPESGNAAVFEIVRHTLLARMTHGRTCILDATNLNDSERRPFVEMAKQAGVPVKVLIMGTTLEDALSANRLRKRRVLEKIILTMNQPPAEEPTVTSRGKVVPKTPPQGFTLESEFPYEVINRGAQLVQVLPSLAGTNYDVVGDTHGLLKELLALLAKAGWRYQNGHLSHPEGRKLLFLGDLVDRGYDSLGVLRLIRQAVLDGVAECLKGNHEDKLVRFIDAALSKGVGRWGSLANAETGVELLRAPDCAVLTEFLRALPAYKVLETKTGQKLAFVHGNLKGFDAELSSADDLIFGQSGLIRGEDTDQEYERRYQAGLNTWTLFRGHIPQTSEQEHIFSLERHPFQKGELVLLHLDQFVDKVDAGTSQREAFVSSLVTEASDFDYEASQVKWELTKGLTDLVTNKLATGKVDASNMLRVFKYSKQTFWNNSWGESKWLTKARGIVLDPAGNIVSHPFDKCFNLHENGTGDDVPDNKEVIEVEKLNGFLGVVSAHPFKKGALLPTTQGSFGNEAPSDKVVKEDFVRYIREYLDVPATRGLVCKFFSEHDVTLMFEVLHPDDPHIIEYPAEMMGLHLIGIRGKKLTDNPWTEAAVDAAAIEMGFRRPKWRVTTVGDLKQKLRESRIEGFMVRENTPEQLTLFKAKSPFYLVNKFLGRMGKSKVMHMYGNPQDFKKTVDEEFYPIVDALVKEVSQETFVAMSDAERVPLVRDLINKML